jgi:2,4-dienoyl-CoA reductase-like NADH-dependent reductase (Old Yellow Enzyme family)
MVTPTHKKLFTPVQVGAISPKHRVVMPAMSRLRASGQAGSRATSCSNIIASAPPREG